MSLRVAVLGGPLPRHARARRLRAHFSELAATKLGTYIGRRVVGA